MSKVRPLEAISDFVADGLLAEALEGPAISLMDNIHPVLRNLEEQEWRCGPEVVGRSVGILDLKMIESAIVHSGLVAPEILVATIDRLSGSELPSLSYEDIVLENPRGDPRTFTRGDVGVTEVAFYRSHRLIEDHLALAINDVRSAIREMSLNGDCDAAAHTLEPTMGRLSEIPIVMAQLGKMPKGHFPVFRKYVGTHPQRDLKGPSGAFSAGVPTLEILLRGDELQSEYLEYIRVNWKYFPRTGRGDLRAALENANAGMTLVALAKSHPGAEKLHERITKLGKFFNAFRRVHYRAVEQQLPEAIADKVAGTGGEMMPGEFLRKRIESTRFPTGEKK